MLTYFHALVLSSLQIFLFLFCLLRAIAQLRQEHRGIIEKCIDVVHETLVKVDQARGRSVTVRGKKSHSTTGKMVCRG